MLKIGARFCPQAESMFAVEKAARTETWF